MPLDAIRSKIMSYFLAIIKSKFVLQMKLSIFLVVICCFQVSASALAQRITLSEKNAPIEKVFREINRQGKVDFVYKTRQIRKAKLVTLDVRDRPLAEVLEMLFQNQPIGYTVKNYTIVILDKISNENQPSPVAVQQITVKGKIVDKQNEPLVGVSVKEKGTNNAISTNDQGEFSLSVKDQSAVLQLSYVGYIGQELSVGADLSRIVLEEDLANLDEVVVVGYGTQKKVNLTGAVDQVTAKVFENRMMPNVTQMLQGVIPNLNIRLGDGKPTQAPSYNIRGTTSIGQGGSALVLIDGVEGDPSQLNPNDIQSVTTLKDAASASIYGARAVFGVVLITTKKPTSGKTSVTLSSNYAIKNPIQVPDFVTDGYTWVSNFAEAFVNGDGSFPQNINKTQKFSLDYLNEFKRRVESGQPYNQVEVDPVTGEYTYYGSTDWYDHLYKKSLPNG